MSETVTPTRVPSIVVDRTKPISDQVYAHLCNQLEMGEINYGDRLNIKALAAEFEVSPMPIRDAIKRLEQEKIVVVSPRSQCYVRVPRKQEILDAIDARRMIERFAVESVYAHVRLDQLSELDSIVQSMREVNDCDDNDKPCLNQYVELDRRFHYQLCALTHNEYVTGFHRSVNRHLSMRFSYGMGACHGVATTLAEHESILENLRAHSPDAISVLDAHLQRSRRNIVREPNFLELPE